MTNIALFNELLDKYNHFSYTHYYIFGFVYKHNVYAVFADYKILPYILKLDKASRGQGCGLRFCPTNEQKTFLLSMGAKLICSEMYFNDVVSNSKYNRGDIFEKMITEKSGQAWKKSNTPFTIDGDVTINNIPYQVKFEKATFTNEKMLASLS